MTLASATRLRGGGSSHSSDAETKQDVTEPGATTLFTTSSAPSQALGTGMALPPPPNPHNNLTVWKALEEQFVANSIDTRHFYHGASVAIMDQSGARYRAFFGEDKPDSIYMLASITKIITAIAALILKDEGKLDIDDPISKHLPKFRPNDSPDKQITIRQCLNHTAGFHYRGLDRSKEHAMMEEEAQKLAEIEIRARRAYQRAKRDAHSSIATRLRRRWRRMFSSEDGVKIGESLQDHVEIWYGTYAPAYFDPGAVRSEFLASCRRAHVDHLYVACML